MSSPSGVKKSPSSTKTGAAPGNEASISPDALETLKKIRAWRNLADNLGFKGAVAAVDHYLAGWGTYVEIPEWKRLKVIEESQAKHIAQVEELLITGGLKLAATKLALEGLVDVAGKAKPQEKWPTHVKFMMEYQSGVEKRGVTDDNLTFYGSQIHSEITIEAEKVKTERTYKMKFGKWKAWVVDNYDWEGEKQFGGSLFSGILPSQQDMKRLQDVGIAKSYQRSSKSWMISNSRMWTYTYDSDVEVEGLAKVRRDRENLNRNQHQQDLLSGALDTPPPAEDIKTSVWNPNPKATPANTQPKQPTGRYR